MAGLDQRKRHVVLQRVVVVRQHDVQITSLEHLMKNLHRITADADKANLSKFDLFAERGDGFLDDLI